MDINSIKTINDLKRDVLEEFIADLPREDKEKLRNFLKERPQKNAAGVFTITRAYIFNTYFRKTPVEKKRTTTFADNLEKLLNLDDDEKEE